MRKENRISKAKALDNFFFLLFSLRKEMSYILDALKKAEHEREMVQFIDYSGYHPKKRRFSLQKGSFWWWIGVLLIMNVLSFSMLLWLKAPLTPPQVYIVPPTASQISNHNPTNPK
jgi:hypothetical protein